MPKRLADEAEQQVLADATPPAGAPDPASVGMPTPPDPTQLGDGQEPWVMFDPEVAQVVHTAVHQGWHPDDLSGALQATGAYREITDRRAALADPNTGQQARDELALQVGHMLGRSAGDPLAAEFADRLASGNATMAGLRTLTDPIPTGTPGPRVMELAALHGIPMSPANASQWTHLDETTLDGQLEQLSQGLHPWKPPGLPFQQFASVFADLHGQELGRQVPSSDPRLQDLMAQAGGDLGRFRQLVRDLPEWEQTPQAKAMIDQRTQQVMAHLLNGETAPDENATDPYDQQRANAGMQTTLGKATGQPPPAAISATSSATAATTPASHAAGGAIGAAMKYLGTPYVWGGESLEEGGFDCSGLVQTAFAAVGVALPRTSREQAKMGTPVGGLKDAQPGDLLFWGGANVHHVAIYMGGGKMIAAPHRGDVVKVQSVYGNPAVRRIDGAGAVMGGASQDTTQILADSPPPSGLGTAQVGLGSSLSGGLDMALNPPAVAPQAAPGGPMDALGAVGPGPAGGGDLSPAERWIIGKESSGRTNADNPTSTAFGLGQLLLANRIKYLGKDYATTDYNKQLYAFREYVKERYRTPEAAMAFWQRNGWY